ncbi:MAG: ACP S-malonyltransferase [Lachnospiraceae bacterium]|nr:ACP S-malonyltransferase [Lachnospiraceae bacterium]
MGKIAFIYPGQGSQKTGMGKDFYENSPAAKKVYDSANEQLDFDLLKLCFETNTESDENNEMTSSKERFPNESEPDINDTKFTQPALVATCLAITNHLFAENIRPDITAGLSLGEYAAIAAAGGIDDIDAVSLVRKRGIYMDSAVPNNAGSMMAILGMTGDEVENVVKDIDDVSVANYNCPGQIVITGKKQAVLSAGEILKCAGAKRTIELNVSGPFHSKYLIPAGEKLKNNLDEIKWQKLNIPYVTNVDAKEVHDISRTKDLLEKQVSSSVMWEQSMRNMIDGGVDTFVEIGPGKTLTGFLRKIDRNVAAYNVSSFEDVEVLKEKLLK